MGSCVSPMKLSPSNDWTYTMPRFRLNLIALLSAQVLLFPQALRSQDRVGIESPEFQRAPSYDNDQAATTSSRKSANSISASKSGEDVAVHLTLSDTADARGSSSIERTEAENEILEMDETAHVYPSQVCHEPGVPRKPHCQRPGDINQSDCPPIRYCQDDCFRAGWPHAVRKWARCSINHHYSAGYVGGGSAWIFPHGRARTCEEGTWGLDYSLLSRPKMVWMTWTNGREQGGLGAYETDH